MPGPGLGAERDAEIIREGTHSPQWRCKILLALKQTVVSPLSGAPQTRASEKEHRLTEEPSASELAKCP